MRKLAAILLVLLTLSGAVAALAAGGNADRTLITQSYLSETYIPDVLRQAVELIDTKTATIYDNAATRLRAQADIYLAQVGGGYTAAVFTEQRFKRGDVLTVESGAGIQLLAGGASLAYDSGTVVDVTAGSEIHSGTALTVGVRYLMAENTRCRVTITSDTAVLAPQGHYAVTLSGETDYNQLATALKSMGMFRGSDTGFGAGYDLEKPPTRVEGLILFLRMLGEEEAALACTEEQPFTDVPVWCERYVAYAYKMGYTRGVDGEKMLFGTQNKLAAWEYLTFILRALGYQDFGETPDFSWENAMDYAQLVGVITDGERTLLNQVTFLRAHTVYLSYFALEANTKGGETLLESLAAVGALNAQRVEEVRSAVAVKRITK